MLVDEGYLNALLLMDLVPSTIDYHLGSILDTFLVPWNLKSSMEVSSLARNPHYQECTSCSLTHPFVLARMY